MTQEQTTYVGRMCIFWPGAEHFIAYCQNAVGAMQAGDVFVPYRESGDSVYYWLDIPDQEWNFVPKDLIRFPEDF